MEMSKTPDGSHTQDILKAAERLSAAGGANIQPVRDAITNALKNGDTLIGLGGAAALGAAAVQNPVLAGELRSAQIAADKIADLKEANTPEAREDAATNVKQSAESNPYIERLMDGLAQTHPDAARAYGAVTSVIGFLIPPEKNLPRMSHGQIMAGALSQKATQKCAAALMASCHEVYKDGPGAFSKAAELAHAPGVNAKELGQTLASNPGVLGPVKPFTTGVLRRKDAVAEQKAVTGLKMSIAEYAGTAQHYAAELQSSEAELSQRFSVGVPALSNEMNTAIERSGRGQDLIDASTETQLRKSMQSETQNILSALKSRSGTQAIKPQLLARLRNVKSKLQTAQAGEMKRAASVKLGRAGPSLKQ